MGRPKALLPIGRECFVSRLARTFAEAGIDDIVVVGADSMPAIRAALDAAGLTVPVVENPHRERGQLSSLQVGLAALGPPEPEAIVMSPVDVPLVSADTVRAIVRRVAAEARAGCAAGARGPTRTPGALRPVGVR